MPSSVRSQENESHASPLSGGDAGTAPFDLGALESKGLRTAIVGYLLGRPLWWMAILRWLWPIARIGRWAIVTRFDDVQEVLSRDEIFPVPYGEKIRKLNGGPNFVLGMRDGDSYRQQLAQVHQAFPEDDIPKTVAPMAQDFSVQAVERSGGTMDAIRDLITLVPTMVSEAYYGVAIPDKQIFGDWTLAMSTYLFGDPTGRPEIKRLANAAADEVRPLVDEAIVRRKDAGGTGTVIDRLLEMQKGSSPALTDETIRAFVMGMIIGFVPTNTLASGKALDVLLDRPQAMARARDAALAGDNDLLWQCVFEAMRIQAPLSPGIFRDTLEDYVLAAGTRRARKIPAGTRLVASTQSAMFDGRRLQTPHDFDPRRPPYHYMVFGHGLHWCAGAHIARAQITQTMKALLSRKDLRRADGPSGRLKSIGPFPVSLSVRFTP